MTTKTRYFVIVSLLVLGVGFGTGLVAYYVGFPAGAPRRPGGPDELRLRPARRLGHRLRQRPRNHDLGAAPEAAPRHSRCRKTVSRNSQNQTGINIETDIDRVVACLSPDAERRRRQGAGMVLARGRFDETKIEALMREHGAQVEDYNGKRLVVADAERQRHRPATPARRIASAFRLSFIEPGLAAIGSTKLIKSAIDLHKAGNNPQAGLESVTGNDELMNLVRSLDNGTRGRSAASTRCASQARLPENVLEPDSGDHLVRGQRPRQRRPARHAPRRDARRRGGQQPARRRPRLPGARQAAGAARSRSCRR